MVVGNGMIAKAFHRYAADERIILFASGVANSGATDEREFSREQQLLAGTLSSCGDKLFIYISTCSIDDADAADTSYVKHKLNMENLVARSATSYLVLRLPQVVGRSSNPHVLVNYIYDRIVRGEPFVVWRNAVRYLIDVEDVVRITEHLIALTSVRNRAVNISSRPSSVAEVVAILEAITRKTAHCTFVEKGRACQIDSTLSAQIAAELNITFDRPYLESILRKYYTHPA